MTKSFAKLSTWLSAFVVLVCATALAGDLKVTYENVQDCVPGVAGYSQAIVDLYVTTGADIGMVTFTSTVAPVDGVAFDPTKVEWDTNVIDTTNAPTAALLSSGKLQLKINAPAPLTAAVQPSANPQHICRIYADVDSTLAGQTVALPFDITAATGIQGTKSVTKNTWLSADSIASVDFNVYKSFNFFLAQGAIFETDEDTPMTISATDTTKFEASSWDTATSTLKPTTDVKFVNVSPIDASVGTIGVNAAYKLVFRPAENWNGNVDIHAVATSTTIADTNTPVDFTITVNPVRDPLVISDVVSTLGGKEGETLGGTITFNVTDVDGGNYIKEASLFVVELGGSVISGTVTRGDTVDNVTPHTFTPNAVTIPYTTVIHPDNRIESCGWGLDLTDSRDADAVVSYTLLGVGGPIEDTDQVVDSIALEVTGHENFTTKTNVSLSATADYTDLDAEDSELCYLSITWADGSGEAPVDMDSLSGTYPKGTVITAYAAYTNFNGEVVNATPVAITVVNSAPEVPVTSGSVFVLRNEDASTPVPGTATFTATDADGLDDLRVTATDLRAAEPASDTSCTVTGTYGVMEVEVDNGTITATYTVNDATVAANDDTEETLTFYVTDADEEDCIPVTVKCTFQANPPPVLTAATTTVTVAEVDAEGNPTAFEVTVTATDTNVYPAGVSAWSITVPDGWNAEAVSQDTGSVDAGTWEGAATWIVTTAGYDTLDGSPRVTSADFGFTVAAVDVATAAEGTLDFTATITDVDRLPSAPTAVALEPAEPVHGNAIVATPAGATDEDGDEITGYTYAWAYSADGESFTDLAETTNTLDDAEAIKKGYTVKVTAFAVTKPYGDAEAVSAEGFEATVVVGNTAPYMSTLGDQTAADADTNLEYAWTVDENSAGNAMAAAATDVDAEAGVDSLTYAVSEIAENIGELAIDAATGEITFTPAADYNTVETGDNVTFMVTVTDESGAAAANTATVTLIINEVNSAPSLTMADQYVMPGDMGVEQTVTVTAEMGTNEDDQEISEAVVEVLSGAEIFSVAPAVVFAGKDVTVTYTVAEDAEMTVPAELKVTITDNGTTAGNPDPLSGEATFKVFLGGSPWYPSIAFECVDPENHTEGHTVVIDGSDGSSYSITLKGAANEVKPADYVAIGHPGYEPNTELTATVYVWTQKGGTSKEVCAEATATVADYDVPGEATAVGEPELGENGWVILPNVSVPLAQSYTIIVTDENGKTTQTIGPVDFEANGEGMILPNIQDLKIQLPEAGDYTISVTGKNPAGKGETVALFVVTIEEDSEAELVWSDGAFAPENGAVLTSESVKFSWPIASGAKSYTLTVYNADGTAAATQKGVSGTSQTLTLKMVEGEATPYTWSVSATNGLQTILSDEFSFNLCESTDSVIITKVAAGADGLEIGYVGTLADGLTVSFDYQYFDFAGMKWSNGTVTAEPAAVGNVLEAPISGADVKAEDYVALRLKVNGQIQGDWVIYEVQDAL